MSGDCAEGTNYYYLIYIFAFHIQYIFKDITNQHMYKCELGFRISCGQMT